MFPCFLMEAYGIVPDELHISITANLGLGIRLRLRFLPPPRACGLQLGLTLRRARVDLGSISGRSQVDLGSISGPCGVDLVSSGSISGRSGLLSAQAFIFLLSLQTDILVSCNTCTSYGLFGPIPGGSRILPQK